MTAKIPGLDRFAQCRELISDEALRDLSAVGCNATELVAYVGISLSTATRFVLMAVQDSKALDAGKALLLYGDYSALSQMQAAFIGLRTTPDALIRRPLSGMI